MLNISGIHEGFVLDHIQAGMSMKIYHDLHLDQLHRCHHHECQKQQNGKKGHHQSRMSDRCLRS